MMDFVKRMALLLAFSSQLLYINYVEPASVDEAENIDTSRCGDDIGCYMEPLNCIYQLNECDYVLTWRVESVSVRFNLTAKMYSHRVLWAAVGLNSEDRMPGASVVDCIVNVSDHNRMIIQMSYNHQHHNHVLKERFVGLANGSMKAAYNGSHIMCSYSRLIAIDRHRAGSDRVMNLSVPRYILLARGPTNEKGVKAEHVDSPSVSRHKISLLKHSYPLIKMKRPAMIRLHVSLMVITWMIVSSVGIIVARYMKSLLTNVVVRHKQLWFAIHQVCMSLTLLFTMLGIIVIFGFLHWEFKFPELHSLLGLITAFLVMINPTIALFRPAPKTRYRYIFRWIHGLFGHGIHLLAVVTIYYGVQEPRAEMPSWTKWTVFCFGIWRILADILLTSSDWFLDSKKHNYVLLRTDLSVVSKDNEHYIPRFNKVVQVVLITAYFTGVLLFAGSLFIAVNMDIG